MPVMTATELQDFLAAAFPDEPRAYRVVAVGERDVTMLLPGEAGTIRPGGTLSGPTVMGLVDAAAWMVTLAHLGPEPMAVTSALSINFLRRPPPADLVARAELLRLGRRQSVSTVEVLGDGGRGQLVAHATVTYSLP